MKKFVTLLATLLVFQLMDAQVYISQEFTGAIWPPIGWSVINQTGNWARSQTANAGGVAPEARFKSAPVFTGRSTLVSPTVNLTGVTHVLAKFRLMVDHNSGPYTVGMATRSGGAGGTWNTVWYQEATSDIPAQEVLVVINNSDVGTTNFQVGFFFEGNSSNINFWYLDAISVSYFEPVNLDAALIAIDVPDMIVGEQPVIGKIFNLGSTTINSVEVKWQLNEGEINTTNFTGLDLTTGGLFNFTCDQNINVDPGSYLLKVWISKVNGQIGDDNPNNDMLQKNISVLVALIQRTPLFEEFTSSTCGPCATFNNTVFNPFINQYGDNIALIKYQMNWPGSGDPYYTAEGGVRRTYYGVNAVPMLYVEGANVGTSQGAVMNAYTTAMNDLAFMEISSQHIIDGYDITIQAEITPYVSEENVRAHVVVIEKLTTGNVGGNGETSFKHVMMKMLPDANGALVDLVSGIPFTLDYTYNMASTYVEEMDDLAVVVFVQKNDKSIFQSAYSEEVSSFVTLGDSNCDGVVNIVDVVTTVNYLIGNNPQPFCFDNADINGDGIINVIDAVGTINIIIGGTKSSNIPIKSMPAHFYINNKGVELQSDGTMAGLQFELEGVRTDDIQFMLEGYEFSAAENNGKLTGVVYSFDNTPIPSGRIELFRFVQELKEVKVGELVAANVNANEIKVVKHQEGNNTLLSENYTVNLFPNPAQREFSVDMFIPVASLTTVKLYDYTGKEVKELYNGILPEGNRRFDASLQEDIKAGVYFLQVKSTPVDSGESTVMHNLKLVVAK
ncbi:MAG: T9SS type A sorting domain-containing protein [Bacteroidales bacterium]|jgi:hypothetical protein|nr:T9SS type A sorting domain-containing protein [Bacteroidales bacterium]